MIDYEEFRCAICGQFLKPDKRTFVEQLSQDYYRGYSVYFMHKKCNTKEKKRYEAISRTSS